MEKRMVFKKIVYVKTANCNKNVKQIGSIKARLLIFSSTIICHQNKRLKFKKEQKVLFIVLFHIQNSS